MGVFLSIIIAIIMICGAIDSFSSSNPKRNRKTSPHSTSYSTPRRSTYSKNKYERRISRWKTKREEFEKQKETPFFKDWKREQWFCQYQRCAWCRKHIELYSPETHVDHIKPLMWWGTNEYTNLVLSCKECNIQKGDSKVGWNGAKGIPGENSKPNWIEQNRCCKNFNNKNDSQSKTDTPNTEEADIVLLNQIPF